MGYKCRECGHKGKYAPQGACPGCGSKKLLKTDSGTSGEASAERRLPIKEIILVGLWGFLAYELYTKFSG